MKESGTEAGVRNIGRLALALIVFALAIGASTWFGFYVAVHKFRRALTQEDRAAAYVGAQVRPAKKISIEVRDRYCVKIIRADVDGSTLRIYGKNECNRSVDYLEWHWKLESPDGTAIAQGYTNQCPIPDPGKSAECVFSGSSYFTNGIPEDDRAASVVTWTQYLY